MSKKKEDVQADKPWTRRNWQQHFAETDYDYVMLIGHLSAVEGNCAHIEKLVSKAQDFETLKKELLKFTKGQQDLVDFINRKWESDQCDKYNLPHLGHG